MPDDRAAAEASRRRKAAARRNTAAVPDQPAVPAHPAGRATPLRIGGWVAYLIALAVFVLFVVLWIRNDIPSTQQLYPLPGIASAFLIIGVWSLLGPALYKSRSTATRAGKYVAAVLLTVIFFPLIVTGIGSLAAWIVAFFPGSPLH